MTGEKYRREFHVAEAKPNGGKGKLLFIMRDRGYEEGCGTHSSPYVDIVAMEQGKEKDTGWTIEHARPCCCCCAGRKTFFHRVGETHAGSRVRRGSHGAAPGRHIFGSAEEPAPCWRRGRTPAIRLFDVTHAAIGTATGPSCFGGCNNTSSATTFRFLAQDGSSVAELVKPALSKEKQQGCCDIVPEEEFTLTFSGAQKEEAKAAVFGGIVLFDGFLNFFDRSWNTCQTNELGEKVCTLCNCHCMGCMCDCACERCSPKDCYESCTAVG